MLTHSPAQKNIPFTHGAIIIATLESLRDQLHALRGPSEQTNYPNKNPLFNRPANGRCSEHLSSFHNQDIIYIHAFI